MATLRFCTGCGNGLPSPPPKFCTKCGKQLPSGSVSSGASSGSPAGNRNSTSSPALGRSSGATTTVRSSSPSSSSPTFGVSLKSSSPSPSPSSALSPATQRRNTTASSSGDSSSSSSGGGLSLKGLGKKVKGEMSDLKKEVKKDFASASSTISSISVPTTSSNHSSPSSERYNSSPTPAPAHSHSSASTRLHRLSTSATSLLNRDDDKEKEREREREKEITYGNRGSQRWGESTSNSNSSPAIARRSTIINKPQPEPENPAVALAKAKADAHAKLRAEQEREERDRAEAERKERELSERRAREAEKMEREREKEKERREREERDRERRDREDREKRDRQERERKEREEKERERKDREDREKRERQERERIDRDEKERERKDRMEREKREKEERDAERRVREEKERVERERERKIKEERDREDRERRERERKERELKEREEKERRDREKRERDAYEREEKEKRDREKRERDERERREREEREYNLQMEKLALQKEERERRDREWKEREEKERKLWEEREKERERIRLREQQEREDREKRERERRDREDQEKRERDERDRQDREERDRRAKELRQREAEQREKEDRERAEREFKEREERLREEQERLERERAMELQMLRDAADREKRFSNTAGNRLSLTPGETLRKHGTGKRLPPVPGANVAASPVNSPTASPRTSVYQPSGNVPPQVTVPPAASVPLVRSPSSPLMPASVGQATLRPTSVTSPLVREAITGSPRSSVYGAEPVAQVQVSNNTPPASPSTTSPATSLRGSSPSITPVQPVVVTPTNAAAAGLAAMLTLKSGGANPFVRPSAKSGSGIGGTVSTASIAVEGDQQSPAPEVAVPVIEPPSPQRKKVVDEIIDTEADYVRDVGVIIEVYVVPLRQQNIITKNDLSAIFSNIEAIHQINKDLLDSLQGDREQPGLIGSAFLKVSPFLKMYAVYCANHESSIAVSRGLIQENKRFQQFVQEAKLKPQCRNLDLASFLIKPVQRICKYPLLLRELLKNTAESHPDTAGLNQALDAIKVTIDGINTKSKTFSSATKVTEVSGKLVQKTKGSKLPQLNLMEKPSRRYVSEGVIAKITPKQLLGKKMMWKLDGYYFLFNDLFLFTKPLKDGTYRLKDMVFLTPATYTDNEMEGHQNTFILEHGGTRTIFSATSPEQKEKLRKELEEIIAANLVKKYESFVKRRTAMHTPAAKTPAVPSFNDWKKDLENKPVTPVAAKEEEDTSVYRFACTDPSNVKKVIKVKAAEATLANLQDNIRRKFELGPGKGFNIVYPRSDGTWQMMPILSQADLDTVIRDKISDLYLSWL